MRIVLFICIGFVEIQFFFISLLLKEAKMTVGSVGVVKIIENCLFFEI